MATIPVSPVYARSANLCTTLAGNVPTTNIAERGTSLGPALLRITMADLGAGQTCTYAIQGSPDGTIWYAIPYADSATSLTVSVATFVLNTEGGVTAYKIIQPNAPARFIRVEMSANTNTNSTIDLWVY